METHHAAPTGEGKEGLFLKLFKGLVEETGNQVNDAMGYEKAMGMVKTGTEVMTGGQGAAEGGDSKPAGGHGHH